MGPHPFRHRGYAGAPPLGSHGALASESCRGHGDALQSPLGPVRIGELLETWTGALCPPVSTGRAVSAAGLRSFLLWSGPSSSCDWELLAQGPADCSRIGAVRRVLLWKGPPQGKVLSAVFSEQVRELPVFSTSLKGNLPQPLALSRLSFLIARPSKGAKVPTEAAAFS